MNKTIILAILFLVTLSIAIITIDTDYKFEKETHFSNSINLYTEINPINYSDLSTNFTIVAEENVGT